MFLYFVLLCFFFLINIYVEIVFYQMMDWTKGEKKKNMDLKIEEMWKEAQAESEQMNPWETAPPSWTQKERKWSCSVMSDSLQPHGL